MSEDPTKLQDVWIRLQGPVVLPDGTWAGINTAIGMGPIKGKTIKQCIEQAKKQLGHLDTPFEIPGTDMEVRAWTQFVVCLEGDHFPVAWGALAKGAGGDLDLQVDESLHGPCAMIMHDANLENFMTDGASSGARLVYEDANQPRDLYDDDADD